MNASDVGLKLQPKSSLHSLRSNVSAAIECLRRLGLLLLSSSNPSELAIQHLTNKNLRI